MSRAIDADALIADCQLAQKQADRRGREFANAFYSGGGEVSTEWWCVEDMIENAPTIEPHCEACEAFNKTRLLIPQPERKKGEWIFKERREPVYDISGVKTWGIAYMCSECGFIHTVIEDFSQYVYCPNCGADLREGD